ncbi:hypothetical protein Salat_1965600 [Sesamum alatum]|uniref:Transmembrane protein n=1 Tax=Sesamum alatum TaxID=300844 RepID=A0AAE2CIW9_9LAMI|nr:hypothetical protein Salat_1965600 [Sesamum alatum]
MSQPLEAYPNPVMRSQPTSSNSNGSFGPVFIVLAVIVVVSAVACVLGRLCSRRHHHRAKEVHHHSKKANNKQVSDGLGPKEWESRQKPSFNMRDGDIEFGFDLKRMPSAKMAGNGGGGMGKPPHHNGGAGHRPEVRFAENV